MGHVGTYCGTDKFDERAAQVPAGRQTLGGYTDVFVVNEKFGIKIPEGYPLEAAGPVMCAGVTMFDPLEVHKAANGTRVGIVGLGGLGQMGIKIAKARGCVVTVISRSAGKKAFATKCGADHFVVSTNPADMKRAAASLDLILNTVPVYHDYLANRQLLVDDGGKQV
jgi:D-arabinose 1-dehydrogenase-like Zn-dependent alcohol dehydrogenase